MSQLTRTGKHHIFFRFLIPYIFVMLIPLFIGIFAYEKTVSLLEEEIVNANMSRLEQSKQTLNERLAEIDRIVQQVSGDPKVNQFMQMTDPFEGSNTYRTIDTQKNLFNYSLSNNFVFRYYLLFKNSSIVMSSSSVYELPQFYRNMMKFGNMDYGLWYSTYMDKYHHHEYLPAQAMVLEGKPYNMVTHVHSLGYPGTHKGILLVLIQNTEIQKLLSGFSISDGGWAYIADGKGTIISSTSSDGGIPPADNFELYEGSATVEKYIGGQNMIISYTTSDYNGWKYVAAQPAHLVLEKVNYIQKITWVVLILGLVAGLIIAYILAYRNSRPLRGLVNIIRERVGAEEPIKTDAYHLIQNTLSNLIMNNDEMKVSMERQLPLLRSAVLGKLFKGEFSSTKEMYALFKHTGMNLQAKWYVAVIVQVRDVGKEPAQVELNEMEIQTIMIKEAAAEVLKDRLYIYEMANGKIALITGGSAESSEESTAQLTQMLSDIRDHLINDYHIEPIIGVGGVYDELLDARKSFEEANQALNGQARGNGDHIYWYSELPSVTDSYFFPAHIAQHLMNLGKAGEKKEVIRILQELYHVNVEKRRLSSDKLRLFLYEAWGGLIKMADAISISESRAMLSVKMSLPPIDTADEADRFFQTIMEQYSHICDSVRTGKKSHNRQLYENMIAYIESSYTSSNFGVANAAERFHISENYLSQFFKEQSGTNFSDYVLELRMKHSVQLLCESTFPIHEVATKAGYNSSNTFCRAFKRYHGISASAYRSSSERSI